ncbi:MAG TPA: CbtA family protein [Acidimicrobiales bacterium]|nr:CbtA family protein [Acidimicrobiales bacterium]
MRRLIRDGALAGLAGGAALALVLLLLGEESIGLAIALEQGDGDEMFSRRAQQVGGVLAALIWGAALGVVFAVVFGLLRRRLALPSDWRAGVGLAVLGFLTVNLVPFLKYPPNPPGVGDPDTIGRRTALYLLMLAWSALAAAAAWSAGRRLGGHPALPEHLRVPAVVAVYVAVVAVGLAGMPASPDAVTAPAGLVWRFRLSSLAGAAAFWAVCGVAFGWLRLAAAGQSPLSSMRAPSRAGPSGGR